MSHLWSEKYSEKMLILLPTMISGDNDTRASCLPPTSMNCVRLTQEINPEYSQEGLMLKRQYFDHMMQTDDLLEKSLLLGKIEGRRRRGHQRVRWLAGITDAMNELGQTLGDGEGQKAQIAVLQSVGSQRVRHDWVTEQEQQQDSLGNWQAQGAPDRNSIHSDPG